MKSIKKGTWYWIAKGFIILFMLFAAYMSYSNAEALRELGFPDYFRVEIIVAKLIGAIVLLIPIVPLRVKEWVYAGFGITMFSALIAHIHHGDPFSTIVFVSVDFTLFIISVRYVSKKEWEQEWESKKKETPITD